MTQEPTNHSPLASIELTDHLPALRRFARALAGGDGDDLVQDALLATARTVHPVRDAGAFLRSVVRRRWVDRSKEARRRAQRERDAARPADAALATPDEQLERAETLRAALKELEHLAPNQRRAIVMRFLEERSVEAIGKELGLEPSSVRSALSRGLEALRVRMDRRLGGRQAWAALLLPATAPGASPGTDPSSAAFRTGARGTRPVASIGAQGIAAIAASIGVASVALGAVWVNGQTSTGSEPTDRTALSGLRAEGLADARSEVGGAAQRVPAAATNEGDTSDAVHADEDTPRPELVLATFVDARTGEAIPGLQVTCELSEPAAPSPADEEHGGGQHTAAAHAVGLHTQRMRLASGSTDSRGSAALLAPDGATSVKVALSERFGAAVPSPESVALPLTGPIPVQVGPTFSLDLRGSARRITSGRVTFFAGARRVADAKLLRDRTPERTWVRFPNEVAELRVEGPYFIEITDDAGFARGRARVGRTVGIEPVPVAIEIAEAGALRVAVPAPGRFLSPMGSLELRLLAEGAERQWHRLGSRWDPGPLEESIEHLVPGTYAWSFAGATGTVDVLPGRAVLLEVPPADALFRAEVVLERGSLGDEVALGALIGFFDPGDPLHGFMLADDDTDPFVPDHTSPDRVVFSVDLPEGAWRVETLEAPRIPRWEADSECVSPASPRIVLRGRRPVERDRVHVRALDRDTLRPLPEGATVQRLRSWELLASAGATYAVPDGDGPTRIQVPRSETPVRLLVLAPDYVPAAVELSRAADGSFPPARVALEPGFARPIRVLSADTCGPLIGADVFVDGARVGATDAFGLVLDPARRSPVRIEVRDAGGAPRAIVAERRITNASRRLAMGRVLLVR